MVVGHIEEEIFVRKPFKTLGPKGTSIFVFVDNYGKIKEWAPVFWMKFQQPKEQF